MDSKEPQGSSPSKPTAVDFLQETWINIDHALPTPPPRVEQSQGAPRLQVHLAKFEPWHAFDVARWSRTSQDLWWLAPNTAPPLTVSKVLGWKRDHGAAFVLRTLEDDTPLGYAELNPMRDDRTHFWLGHIVVRPDRRHAGLGRALLRCLLEEAFEHRKAERLSLIVFPENVPAINCYRAVGFTSIAEEFHQFRGTGPRHRLDRMQINAWGYFESTLETMRPNAMVFRPNPTSPTADGD